MAMKTPFDPCTMATDPSGKTWRVEGGKLFVAGNEKNSIPINIESQFLKLLINYTGEYALIQTENKIIFIKNLKGKPELFFELDDSYYEFECLLDLCWSSVHPTMVIIINKIGNISTFDVNDMDFGEECTVSYPVAIAAGSPNSLWGRFCIAVSNKAKRIIILSPLVYKDTVIDNYTELTNSVPQNQQPLLSKYFSEDLEGKTISTKLTPSVFPIDHIFDSVVKSMQWVQNQLFVLTEEGEIFELEIPSIYPFESSGPLKVKVQKVCEIKNGKYLVNQCNNIFVFTNELIPLSSSNVTTTGMTIETKIELLQKRKDSIDQRERNLEDRKQKICSQLAELKETGFKNEKKLMSEIMQKFEKLPSIPAQLSERDQEIFGKLKEIDNELQRILSDPKLKKINRG